MHPSSLRERQARQWTTSEERDGVQSSHVPTPIPPEVRMLPVLVEVLAVLEAVRMSPTPLTLNTGLVPYALLAVRALMKEKAELAARVV